MTPTNAQSRFVVGAQWCAIGLGFSLPISTAVDNVLLGIFIILWLFSGDLAGRMLLVRNHPVASLACVFAALMLLGTLWSDGSIAQIRDGLVDALRLMLLGAFAIVFLDPSTRDRAQFAFLLSMTLVLTLSILLWSGIIDPLPEVWAQVDQLVFKPRAAHSVLMAVAAILFALHAMESRNRPARTLLWFLSGTAIIDVYLVSAEPAGQLGFAAAALYIVFLRRSWRDAAIAATALIVLAGAVSLAPGSPSSSSEPIGQRLEVYRNALDLIAEHPVIGVGTGSFRSAYEGKVRGTQVPVADHPHNAFLHVGSELGLLGLIALIALLGVQWRSADTLVDFADQALARSFTLVIVGAALVSISFSDHTEGLLYAWASGLFFAKARWPERLKT